LQVGGGIVDRPLHDAGLAAEERTAEFGNQLLLAVWIGCTITFLRHHCASLKLSCIETTGTDTW
jgi:hypothetical protein